MNTNFTILIFCALLFSCSKKSADVVQPTIPERIEVLPSTVSKPVGDTAIFSIKYYNNLGNVATPPSNIIWSSSNTAIATVNQAGVATAVGVGQVQIIATLNNTITASSLFTIVANNTQVATITLNPSNLELLLNQTTAITATAFNISGNMIPNLSYTWSTSNNSQVSVSNGLATAVSYGSAEIRASANGIQSAAAIVSVVRKGNFSGTGSAGMAKLKFENGTLKLQTTSDFSVSNGPPDLRIYLGNNNNNINGAAEIATLAQRNGAQTWNLPSSISITQFRYVIVWCKQFGGTYGVADLGQ